MTTQYDEAAVEVMRQAWQQTFTLHQQHSWAKRMEEDIWQARHRLDTMPLSDDPAFESEPIMTFRDGLMQAHYLTQELLQVLYKTMQAQRTLREIVDRNDEGAS